MKSFSGWVRLLLLGLAMGVSESSPAQERLVVTRNQSPVHSKPDPNSEIVGRLKKGSQVMSAGSTRNGFRPIKSRRGKSFWIKEGNLRPVDLTNEFGIERPASRRESPRQGPLLTWDLGFSSGEAGDVSYSEAALGLNAYFKPWLAWRNAAFYRFIGLEDVEDVYGLDSMARFSFRQRFSGISGITFFGGPGYRFVNEGDNVPFAEGGLILKLGGLSIGGGVRTFFTKLVNDNLENDNQFFIVLTGSGIL